MTPAQRAQQSNRDVNGRYTQRPLADPGSDALDRGFDRWRPPTIAAGFQDRAGHLEVRGADIEKLIQETDTSTLLGQIRDTFPHLPDDEAAQLAVELATCQTVAEWMDVHGGDAAWEAEAWDDQHPGEFPLLRVEPGNYVEIEDGEVGYDWPLIAEDNAASNRQAIVTLWRQAELRDSKLASSRLARKPAA